MCTHCNMAVDENGEPDPVFYNQKFLESFALMPRILKCKHVKRTVPAQSEGQKFYPEGNKDLYNPR